jgi:5-methylcytosine-specific restriction endonuclease McrBC regulatory subunit McrC
MRILEIVESRYQPVHVTSEEARLLNELGRKLASNSKSWRADENENVSPERSIISCANDGTGWRILVRNAVGVIRVDELQIVIKPKVPLDHFIYLMSFSSLAPRSIADRVHIAESTDLLELIASWYMQSLEAILRRDLIRDYHEWSDELSIIRGQLDAVPTAQKFYSGRVNFDCMYDEFSSDTALNRVLRSAATRVVGQGGFSNDLRRRASRAIDRIGAISELQPADLLARADRRTGHYAGALALAHLLLKCEARTIDRGNKHAWSFLIPTADAVEEGIRCIIAEALAPRFRVVKQGMRLTPTSLTVNPDLVFVQLSAIGDVKYKLSTQEWPRTDLYQAVAFASAFKANVAVVVCFGATSDSGLPAVPFGDIQVNSVVWPSDVAPEDARKTLCSSVAAIVLRDQAA